MSTEDQNKVVVTLKQGVDVDAFIEDMVSGTNHSEFMPGRKVELYNEKPDSLRNVDFVLTREEAAQLSNDPRIIEVRYGTKKENGIELKSSVLEASRLYSKTTGLNNTHYNWGIPSCIASTNPFSSTTYNYAHSFTLSGRGVDIVISDSGIDPTHPEWLDYTGTTSRFQVLDWPTASGLSGTYTQSANHYTDPDGHGTHVAGTAAGRLYGWAKSANIYAITVLDNPAAFGVSASFNMIRSWHNLKTTQANGYKRPTIVNCSWEYYATYANITGGVYRGSPWSGNAPVSVYGMLQTIYNRQGTVGNYTYIHPVRVASVDADIADAIAAGVIIIGAAGNDAHKVDISSGSDYNNYYIDSVDGVKYYHRGGTPSAADGVIAVGSVRLTSPEAKSNFSNPGPRIQLYPPGEAIMSAIPATSTQATSAGTVAYPLNSSFKSTKLSGTSMASPQVVGVLACIAEARPSYGPADWEQWITTDCTSSRLTDTGGGFTDTQSLQGGVNLYLKQPFARSEVYSITKS